MSVLSSSAGAPIVGSGNSVNAYWSGSAAELPEASDGAANGGHGTAALWTADPRTWGRPGWTALERVCASLGEGLVLRAHALHVVSDIPGCVRALSVLPNLRLLIDPASMVPGEMLRHSRRDALDHLRRTYEWCGGLADQSRIFGLLVANVRADLEAPGGVRAVPVSQAGVFEAQEIREMARACLGSGVSRVLIGADGDQQREYLEG